MTSHDSGLIRQRLVLIRCLPDQVESLQVLYSAECAFHLWLQIPKSSDWNPSELAVQLRQMGVSAVSSAAFSTDNNPPKAVRLCFGGPISREQWQENLSQVADLIEQPSYLSTGMH